MRRILLALGFTLICGPAFAVCPSPITGKDAAGTTQNIGTVVDGSGKLSRQEHDLGFLGGS